MKKYLLKFTYHIDLCTRMMGLIHSTFNTHVKGKVHGGLNYSCSATSDYNTLIQRYAGLKISLKTFDPVQLDASLYNVVLSGKWYLSYLKFLYLI